MSRFCCRVLFKFAEQQGSRVKTVYLAAGRLKVGMVAVQVGREGGGLVCCSGLLIFNYVFIRFIRFIIFIIVYYYSWCAVLDVPSTVWMSVGMQGSCVTVC
jgi:hypothetical protein